MSKRGADSPPAGAAEPPAKKIVFEPLQLGRCCIFVFLVFPSQYFLCSGEFMYIAAPSISNLEELDLKTLTFQNRKLGEGLAAGFLLCLVKIFILDNELYFLFPGQRLGHKNRVEEQLRERIDQLEKRQTQDDAVINVINRYWNQLNEDIRILLQR